MLTRRDLRQLGLRLADAGPDEERLLGQLAELLDLTGLAPTGDGPAGTLAGIIATDDFLAFQVIRRDSPEDAEWQFED